MPIGKQSINRVAKKADTEEIKPVAAEQPTKSIKPATSKKSGTGATRTKTVKLTPPEVDPVRGGALDAPSGATRTKQVKLTPPEVDPVGGGALDAPSGATRTKQVKLTPPEVNPVGGGALDAPSVTEHVIANIDPVVVERVVGKETPAPKDGKVKLTDPMPSYLL